MTDRFFDIRTRERYLKKGLISKKDIESFVQALPNDEDNFELTVFEDDDLLSSTDIDQAVVSDEAGGNSALLEKISAALKDQG